MRFGVVLMHLAEIFFVLGGDLDPGAAFFLCLLDLFLLADLLLSDWEGTSGCTSLLLFCFLYHIYLT